MDNDKVDEQYHVNGDGQPYVNEQRVEDDTSLLNLTTATTRKTAAAGGRWGSTFWKDCQPSHIRHESESGQESKSTSCYNNEDASDNDNSEVDKANRGQNVDEMLSDDYYELDGDDQTDSLHHKFLNNAAASFNSIPYPQVAANKFVSRKKPKVSSYVEDADFEDDEEEEDEDDPAGADFDPDLVNTSVERGLKDELEAELEELEGAELECSLSIQTKRMCPLANNQQVQIQVTMHPRKMKLLHCRQRWCYKHVSFLADGGRLYLAL